MHEPDETFTAKELEEIVKGHEAALEAAYTIGYNAGFMQGEEAGILLANNKLTELEQALFDLVESIKKLP